MKRIEILLCLLLQLLFINHSEASALPTTPPYLSYYFLKPASTWNEAIPIGNGRMGGMVFGGVGEEKIQLNDDTFWSGEPRNLQKPGQYKYLDEIRKALYAGDNVKGEELINRDMLGPYNESYMPLADLLLTSDKKDFTDYKRSLDFSRGIVTVTYRQGNVRYKREMFASYPDNAIVIRLTADKKSISFIARFNSLVRFNTTSHDNQLIIRGQAPKHIEPSYVGVRQPVYEEGHGMRFEGRLIIRETDGTVTSEGGTLQLKNASHATLIFVDATSFNGFDKDPYREGKNETAICQQYISKVQSKNYPLLYRRHVDDFTSLFHRVQINLGTSTQATLPIDERIKRYQPGLDPALTALYYQFGRYLLISSSRPGTQPANLQGIWNNQLQPSWSANWTMNCNAEINYWPVEEANLSECHLPFMEMTRESAVDGAKTAQNLYHCRGWIVHHNIDLWRTTWPVDGCGCWAIYQVGSAWMCQHIWDHYQYTLDKAFLRSYYSLLRGATQFYLDNLQTDKDGYLVTNPSIAFENHYRKPDGTEGWACIGSAQDMQMIRSLFMNTMDAIDILGEDKEMKSTIGKALAKLAPIKVSPTTGRIQEWNEDLEPADLNNAEVSQGWGLVESNLISLRKTPDLAAAFRKTIDYRKPQIRYNSGSWTGAFPAMFWARLAEPDSTQKVVDRHFLKALYPNLTCSFFDSWQIDGNLGIASAIGEMLLQSQDGDIHLLPALPTSYQDGYVTGLKARGNYTVDIYWHRATLEKAVITSALGGKVIVRYKDKSQTLTFKPHERKSIAF